MSFKRLFPAYDGAAGLMNIADELSRRMLHFPEERTQKNLEDFSMAKVCLAKSIRQSSTFDKKGELIGPLRNFCERVCAEPKNANTMDTGLLRQVIFSVAMRAFRRRLVILSLWTTKFERVPLAGTDKMEVRYYPLDTVGSSDYVQANGYQITPNAQTLKREVPVGGIGSGAKIPGIGRKYKGLAYTGWETNRLPFLNRAVLATMAGEQLAVDVVNDVISANVTNAYFGPFTWMGPAAALNLDTVTQFEQTANRLDWPDNVRSIVLDSSYYANLNSDPSVKSYLKIGSTEPIQKAKIGRLLSFDVYQNPRLPATVDGVLAGWISLPNAVLFASAPVLPSPGEAHRMLLHDAYIDDESGLSLVYKIWGDPMVDTDYEVLECSYGSAPGELAALKRLVSQGN